MCGGDSRRPYGTAFRVPVATPGCAALHPGLFSFSPSGRTPCRIVWLRSKGEGHLTRINNILKNLMDTERRIGSGK
jgi:hypothetical protein